jgi:type II secretory pathway predicted ATPase ExeA
MSARLVAQAPRFSRRFHPHLNGRSFAVSQTGLSPTLLCTSTFTGCVSCRSSSRRTQTTSFSRGTIVRRLRNPTLTRAEFIEMLSTKFELSTHASRSKAALLNELELVLRQRRDRGEITALMIDEAQSLSYELLEEIRLLANSETPTEKLLPLVLAGQPELRDRLNETELRQLKQRVTLRCEIRPFTVQETAAYIAWRIRIAGGEAAKVFTREAVMLIHERSRGIPRTISVICDNAMVTGFALGRQPVTQDMVLEVVNDLDIAESVSEPPRTTSPGDDARTHGGTVQRDDEVPPVLSTASSVSTVDTGELAVSTPRERPRFSLFGLR